jgi:hypothetical protein
MQTWWKRLVILTSLGGCAVQPVLIGSSGYEDTVKVSVIAERLGQQLRMTLQDYFPGRAPHHELKVKLETKRDSLMIEEDATTRRYQLTLKADFELLSLDQPSLKYHSTTEALASYNFLSVNDPIYGAADYSNIVAQEAATERALVLIAQKIRWQVISWLSQHHSGTETLKGGS